jgi:hypothetical protein
MDEYRVRVIENRVLIRNFGHEREEVTGKQRNEWQSFTICIPYQTFSGQ